MNTANQIAEEIYGLHCDIGRLEKEKEHWHTEFINEHEYAHMMEEQAEKAETENAKLRKLVRIMHGELVSCEDNGYVCGGHKFDERVRELGIEVD